MRYREFIIENNQYVKVVITFTDGVQHAFDNVPVSLTKREDFAELLIAKVLEKEAEIRKENPEIKSIEIQKYSIAGQDFPIKPDEIDDTDEVVPDDTLNKPDTVEPGENNDETSDAETEIPVVPDTQKPDTQKPQKPEDVDNDQVTTNVEIMYEDQVELEQYARRYNGRVAEGEPLMGGDGYLYDGETRLDQNITDLDLTDPKVLEMFEENEFEQEYGTPYPRKPTAQDLTDAFNNVQGLIQDGKVDNPAGSGSEGEDSDEGLSGEEGAMTGDQEAEIPTIIENLRKGLSGIGTNESRVFFALDKIKNKEHFEAVMEMYQQEYGSSLSDDIISDYRREKNSFRNFYQINTRINKFGYRFVSSGMTGNYEFTDRTIPGARLADQPTGVIENTEAGTYDPIQVSWDGYQWAVRTYPDSSGRYDAALIKRDGTATSFNYNVTDKGLKDEIDDEIQRRSDEAFGDKPDGLIGRGPESLFAIRRANQIPRGQRIFGNVNVLFLGAYMDGRRIMVSQNKGTDGKHYYGESWLVPPRTMIDTLPGLRVYPLENEKIIKDIEKWEQQNPLEDMNFNRDGEN